jgi:hypothetical protein
LAEAIEAKQQAPELIFPGEHPFDRPEALFKNSRLEERLASALGLFSTSCCVSTPSAVVAMLRSAPSVLTARTMAVQSARLPADARRTGQDWLQADRLVWARKLPKQQ